MITPTINRALIRVSMAIFLTTSSCIAQSTKPTPVTAGELLRILGAKNSSQLTAAFDKSQKLYADRVALAFQKYHIDRSSEVGLFLVLPSRRKKSRNFIRSQSSIRLQGTRG